MTIIKEITREEPYLVINKPSGLPSAPLNENDRNNAFSIAAELFPELLNVTGRKEIEHGLLHRIDTETSGLLIIAATQDSYEKLLQLQKPVVFVSAILLLYLVYFQRILLHLLFLEIIQNGVHLCNSILLK